MRLGFALIGLLPVLHVAHLTGLRNTLAAFIAGWTVTLLVSRRALPPLALPVLAWLALGLASASWSLNAEATLKSVATDIVMPLGVFYAAYHASALQRTLGLVASALAASMAILATLALSDVGGPSFLAYYYPGPGVASTVALYALPFGFLLTRNDDRRLRALALGVLGLVVVVGALTLNRMFWPSLLVGLFVFAIWHWPVLSVKKRRTVVLGIVGAAAATALAIAYINGIRGPDDGRRIQALREWTVIAADAIWFGHGFGKKIVHEISDGKLSAPLSRADSSLRWHAHNLFLDVVLQVGVVGLTMFCILLFALGAHAYRARDPARLSVGGALVALIAAMAVKNMTDDFMSQAVVVAFWLHAGLLLGRLRPAPA